MQNGHNWLHSEWKFLSHSQRSQFLNSNAANNAWLAWCLFEISSKISTGFHLELTRRNDGLRHGLKSVKCESMVMCAEVTRCAVENFTIQTWFARVQLLTWFDCFWRFVETKTMVFRSQTISFTRTRYEAIHFDHHQVSKRNQILLFILRLRCCWPFFEFVHAFSSFNQLQRSAPLQKRKRRKKRKVSDRLSPLLCSMNVVAWICC